MALTFQQFVRTRVLITVDDYKNNYDNHFDDEYTARIYVYKDGLYIRETIFGYFLDDLGAPGVDSLENAEKLFWDRYGKDFYNKSLELPQDAKKLLVNLRKASAELSVFLLVVDDDVEELLTKDYPETMPCFIELNSDIAKWIDKLLETE